MASGTATVYRFEVTPKAGAGDAIGERVRREAGAMGVKASGVRATAVYLVQSEGELSGAELKLVGEGLLANAVTETVRAGAGDVQSGAQVIEVHPLPGVMDPVAQSVQLAIKDLLGREVEVSSGWRYDVVGVSRAEADALGKRLLANPVIQRVSAEPWTPARFPVGKAHDQQVREVAVTKLSDEELVRLSRSAHLFLSLEEMKAVRGHYRGLGREPRDIELETIAQTWSEHCVHKTLKSTVRYRGAQEDRITWSGRPGHTVEGDGTVVIKNLLKSTVAAATFELIAEGVDWTLSVFKDNSGVIALDEQWGVCIKVETHNRPSAIEPYGGAATGVGGCIRDVIGTGLGAKPIANMDVFCVGEPGMEEGKLPPGTLPPRRILQQVVAGVRDYGNRMGIPTVNGAVYFDERYVGNPLVYCGCVGLMPRDKVNGAARVGDRIIAVGGRTGRDGVHGATFSSAELEENAADEFSHAVQIGNAITEKQVLDAILRARDYVEEEAGGDARTTHDQAKTGPLYHGMTDCGAGGFSSAIGEMGGKIGAEVELERAPLKYAGLSYTEVWISEAQERMVLAVPAGNVEKLKRICDEEGVKMADLGVFGTAKKDLILKFKGADVGRIDMEFLHEGIPMPVKEAVWAPTTAARSQAKKTHIKDALLTLLAHPNIASKHWIIRQYDHEVQGNTVVKPLVGPGQRGPSDAAVIEPIAGSGRGIAIACGLQTWIGDAALGGDPYLMTLAAIDECVRNLVCVGADPHRTAILDNFCWPSCEKPENMGTLVRAAEACYDGAKAYRTPFVSGKDSINNQLRYKDPATGREVVIEIPPTLLISGLGIVPRMDRVVTMDAKGVGNVLVVVGAKDGGMGGSHFARVFGGGGEMPVTDLTNGPAAARLVAGFIARGMVRSAHDVSDGGVLCAVAEMLIGGSGKGKPLGAKILLANLGTDLINAAFNEGPSRYVLEVSVGEAGAILKAAEAAGLEAVALGVIDGSGVLTDAGCGLSVVVGDLAGAWLGTLDW